MISYYAKWILNAQKWKLLYVLALIPSFSKGDAPQNYPSWFIVPQRLAGYPLYLPQQPVFASGGSSDFVSSWGDFRFNNFYDSTGNAPPDNAPDPLYDHFQEFLAGNWTPPAETPAPPAAAPAEAGDAAADAAADAAEDRPAREFADKNKKRRKNNPLAKSRALAESLADDLVQTLMKILAAGSLSSAIRANSSIPRNLPSMAAILLPALSKLAADTGKNISTTDGNTVPLINSTVITTTTASVISSGFMPSNLSANPNVSDISANQSIFKSSKTETRTMAPQVTDDLVQLAISWPPVATQRGVIALPNPVGPRPLEILNELADNPFRDFERRSLGADTGGNSVSNASTFSNKDFANLVRSAVNRTGFPGAFPGVSNRDRTRVMQKIVVPAYLADFAVVPLLSQSNNTNNGPSPTVTEQSMMTYNPRKNSDNQPMDQQTLLANMLSIMRTQKTKENPPALSGPSLASPESQGGTPAPQVQFQQSGDFPFFAEVQPTPKPLFKALRPSTPPITAACMVILGANRQYLGKCVDSAAVPYECDGMGIKRSQFCPAAASCCFVVSNE